MFLWENPIRHSVTQTGLFLLCDASCYLVYHSFRMCSLLLLLLFSFHFAMQLLQWTFPQDKFSLNLMWTISSCGFIQTPAGTSGLCSSPGPRPCSRSPPEPARSSWCRPAASGGQFQRTWGTSPEIGTESEHRSTGRIIHG